MTDPVARLSWAAHHYRTLKNELHGGVDRMVRPVRVETHRSGLEYRFYVKDIEPLDERWPFVFGDCLHSLRASLDHLVFQLHLRHFRGNVPKAAIKDSGFPIFVKPPTVQGGGVKPLEQWPTIKRLAARERTAIAWLQPYHRRNDWATPFRQALRDVHTLDIADKHRQPHFVHVGMSSVPVPNAIPPELGFRNDPQFGVPLVSNAHVDTWTFVKPPPSHYVDMHPGVESTVGLEHGGERLEVLANLGGCVLCVAQVINRFADRFPSLGDPIDLSWIRRT
ncbi:MAG: hypothetical protein ACLPR9_00030 [Acidimicrobiales bacterium]